VSREQKSENRGQRPDDRRQMVKLENEVSLAEDDLTILVI